MFQLSRILWIITVKLINKSPRISCFGFFKTGLLNPYSHLRPDNSFLWEAVLGLVGCLVASLFSLHQSDNSLSVFWRQNYPQLKTTVLKYSENLKTLVKTTYYTIF